ncbi:hypothetical protein HYU14_06335 [Candidatus Woesearchaeota archaeon]|nr:hypothetical protein [Candidatus Woesearchaeota archaeon]
MAEEKDLEGKVKQEERPGFVEKLCDMGGAAIGTSMLLKALLSGLGYASLAAYLITYGSFRAVKHTYRALTNPENFFTLRGIGDAIGDSLSNIIPHGPLKVPAAVGVLATGAGYLGGEIFPYLAKTAVISS